MGLSIARTPNGRFYVWNDAAEKGWRVSPFFKTLEEMVQRRSEIDTRRGWSERDARYFIIGQYAQGWLPLWGPDVKPEEVPEWMADIDPGHDGIAVPIMEGDVVYVADRFDGTRRKMNVVKRLWHSSYGEDFECISQEIGHLGETRRIVEREMWKVKKDAR